MGTRPCVSLALDVDPRRFENHFFRFRPLIPFSTSIGVQFSTRARAVNIAVSQRMKVYTISQLCVTRAPGTGLGVWHGC
eukprot:scaffold60_cov325-Pavlova_lutheri.AAC.8